MLFGRQVLLRFGPSTGTVKELAGLRVAFSVKLSTSSTPNAATLQVYNPNEESISLLQDDAAVIELYAGYDVARLRFRGNPTRGGVTITRQGPDRIVKIEAQEAGLAWRTQRVSLSYTEAVPVSTVYADIAAQLGLPAGVVRASSTSSFAPGLALQGRASDVLDRLARMTASELFTRDGALCLIGIDEDTGDSAPVFSAASGNLIGSPEPTNVGSASGSTRTGGLRVRALLDADLRPGQLFIVQSERYSGTYKAVDVEFHGDSGFGDDFYVVATGKAA